MYFSPAVVAVITTMIVSGAARSLCVKLFYQLGFEHPLFVTLLYLLGHALALIVYGISYCLDREDPQHEGLSDHQIEQPVPAQIWESRRSNIGIRALRTSIYQPHFHDLLDLEEEEEEEEDHTNAMWAAQSGRSTRSLRTSMYQSQKRRNRDEPNTSNPNNSITGMNAQPASQPRPFWGSVVGFTAESKTAVQWVHVIPWYLKPVIPGLCNLIKSALRWSALAFVAASVAEIMAGGMELVFSVLAARLVRKRLVSRSRWRGIVLVLVGVVGVACTDSLLSDDDDNDDDDFDDGHGEKQSLTRSLIGVLLIVAQSLVSALQDIVEEIFLDESDFPATLLLGMEGLFGFLVGAAIYYPVAPLLNEDPGAAWSDFGQSRTFLGFGIFLVVLFLFNGIANILTTAATSSMTRNVWKSVRTALVWFLGLIIYYSTRSSTSTPLGEPWDIPKSFFMLLGFSFVFVGIKIYYTRVTERETAKDGSDGMDSSQMKTVFEKTRIAI